MLLTMRVFCVPFGLIALACCIAGGRDAKAEELPSPSFFSKLRLPAGRTEFSNGFDVTANGWNAYSTMVIAPTAPLDADGWRLKLSGGYGSYGYETRDATLCKKIHDVGHTDPDRALDDICDSIAGIEHPEIDPATKDYLAQRGMAVEGDQIVARTQHRLTQYQAAAAPGYQFTLGTVILKSYLGVGYELREVAPPDASKPLSGAYWGAQAALEAWAPLGADGWMSADASYFTGTSSRAISMKLGYRARPWLSLGPEFAAFGDADDTSGRAGAFVRIDALGVETTLAGGLSGTYKDDPSTYGSASVYMKF